MTKFDIDHWPSGKVGAPCFERCHRAQNAGFGYAERESVAALSGACARGFVPAPVSADLMSRRLAMRPKFQDLVMLPSRDPPVLAGR